MLNKLLVKLLFFYSAVSIASCAIVFCHNFQNLAVILEFMELKNKVLLKRKCNNYYIMSACQNKNI